MSEVTHEQSWTREDIEEAAKERTFTLGSAGDQGKIVEAGKKWKVFQNVGRVGYWKIKKLKLKSYDCDCNSICAIDRKNYVSAEEDETTAFYNLRQSTSLYCTFFKYFSTLCNS